MYFYRPMSIISKINYVMPNVQLEYRRVVRFPYTLSEPIPSLFAFWKNILFHFKIYFIFRIVNFFFLILKLLPNTRYYYETIFRASLFGLFILTVFILSTFYLLRRVRFGIERFSLKDLVVSVCVYLFTLYLHRIWWFVKQKKIFNHIVYLWRLLLFYIATSTTKRSRKVHYRSAFEKGEHERCNSI